MKIMATLHCEECGETWNLTKDLRDIEDDDLRCCGKKATIEKAFRSNDDRESAAD